MSAPIFLADGAAVYVEGSKQPRCIFGTVAGYAVRYGKCGERATHKARLSGQELCYLNAEATVIARYSAAERAQIEAAEAARIRVKVGDTVDTEYGLHVVRLHGTDRFPDPYNVRLVPVTPRAPTWVKVQGPWPCPAGVTVAEVVGHWFDGERGGTNYRTEDGHSFRSTGHLDVEEVPPPSAARDSEARASTATIPVEGIGEVVELRWTRDDEEPATLATVSLPDGSDVPLRRLPDGRWMDRRDRAVRVLTPDGGREVVRPKGAEWVLEELRALIGGGYIEIVHLPGERILVCDEDGHRNGGKLNRQASDAFCGDIVGGGSIVGIALLADTWSVQ